MLVKSFAKIVPSFVNVPSFVKFLRFPSAPILPEFVKVPLLITSAIIEPFALFVNVPPTVNES